MRVFIGPSATQTGFATAVGEALTRAGFEVWNPDRELLPGDNWLLEAGRALERADAVVLLLSADSTDSPWAKLVQYVITQPKFEFRVFPIRVGKPAPKVPWILRGLVIDAPTADAEAAAHEIAMRLRPAKTLTRARKSKRRVRSTSLPAITKATKSTKRESKTPRRAAPTG